jgi:transcriptional regulator with XRE-family HTH domain
MNVDSDPPSPISPSMFETVEMRSALACRDITAVYARLQRCGISQRRIAALTGQSPSEVYEVLGGRRVMAYDVLLRIADGLGVPRGYLGLAYDESTHDDVERVAASCSTREAERDEVRRHLAHAAEVTMGTALVDVTRWWRPVARETSPPPTRVGLSDVHRVEVLTLVMRRLDYRYGGGACHEAVRAQAEWAQQLLRVAQGEQTTSRLHLALADLHNLVGWTSFDIGLHATARRHFARALEQARHAGSATLVANILYRLGRLHLHRGWLRDGLRFFQLGQIAAQDSGCELTVSMLCVNEAWAHALLGDVQQATKSIGRAQDEFARAALDDPPSWVRFFGAADLHASVGMVHLALSQACPDRLDDAAAELTTSLAERGDDMARSTVFELTALATVQLRTGESDAGIRTGHHALDLAEQVRSVRTIDRLRPLQVEARRGRRTPGAEELAARITALRAA